MTRTIIIGGGVIGLSIAYELSNRGQQVILLERDRVGRQASWAGAGILPPVNAATAIHPLEKLESFSIQLHEQWATELNSQTGIDNGFRHCGGLYIARTRGEKAALSGLLLLWDQRQIKYDNLTPQQLGEIVPSIQVPADSTQVFVPGEFQLHNPHHLQALDIALRKNGVEIYEDVGAVELVVKNDQTEYVLAGDRKFFADHYCVACGPWSESLVQPFDIPLPSTPVRGQMVLFKLPQQTFLPVINEGTRYLVPRADGHVLTGSTIEEVGFNVAVEAADIKALEKWACELVPTCNDQTVVKAWAGLRPGTFDGFPYLGPIGRSKNSWVATGHFKAGLHLSTGTAVVMADLIEGKSPTIDLTPFAPRRAEFHQA